MITQLPEHIANAFIRENGFYTAYAIVKENTKRRKNLFETNLKTLESIQVSRSGFFALYDKELAYIEFSTDKGYGHNLLVDGEDVGISFEEFPTMIVKSEDVRKHFSENISNAEIGKISFSELQMYLQDLKQFYQTNLI